MKAYTHDPNIYQKHFNYQVGNALPGFRGERMQYGYGIGSILGAIARRAMPLLRTGAKIIAPHLKNAAKNIAEDVGGRVVQELFVNKRKAQRKSVSRRKKFKASTSKKDYLN